MNIDWTMVRARYEQQKTILPLSGQSKLDIASVDDEKICFQHRLWRDITDCSRIPNLSAVVLKDLGYLQ